jgi:hypothetical protein
MRACTMLKTDWKELNITQAAPRRQPPFTIRSTLATVLLRRLTSGGRSQVDILEEALESMASQRKTLSEALTPPAPQPFD